VVRLWNPDELGVPVNFVTEALPELVEPAELPVVPVPAARDGEVMVRVRHRRIRVLAPYWHAGWEHASPDAFLRAGAAERLERVAESLPEGFGLAVLDAWRPLALQAEIHQAAYADALLPAGFVSAPSADPTTPPPHLTGGTVDVTLTWQQHPLRLGSNFDDFTDDARAGAYEAIPGRVRQLRRLLHAAMREQGFRVIECEWWHYEIGTRRWAALTGEPVWYGAADVVVGEPRFATEYRIVRPRIPGGNENT
jgi:D-alanyl-D-alanine dipeptidase